MAYEHGKLLCVCYLNEASQIQPTPSSWAHSQFIGAVDGLGYPVTILQVGGHLKGVDVDVGRLAQSHELPQRHSESPLGEQQQQSQAPEGAAGHR